MSKYVQAELPTDLAEWVDRIFLHGQKSAFIIECFSGLRDLMEKGKLPPPSEYARQATLAAISSMAKEE